MLLNKVYLNSNLLDYSLFNNNYANNNGKIEPGSAIDVLITQKLNPVVKLHQSNLDEPP